MARRARWLAFASILGAIVAIQPSRARADEDAPEPPKRFFYHGYDYGSQSLYGPIYVIVNRGWDVLQLAPHDRVVYHQDYLANYQNVWDNVASPFGPISRRGWWRFTREEILPLSWTPNTARWIPNYGLHLIGGGQTFAELREWFMDREATAAAATVFSAATLYTAAFLNEAIENSGIAGDNTDCLADLYVFDSLGMVLFSSEAVRRFFSKYIIISDWSLQPAITYPHGDIHNQGNYYSAKLPIPWYPRLALFGYTGFSSMAGLSFHLDREYSISAAFGGKVTHLDSESHAAVVNHVDFRKTGALFVDRNESLLASIHVADVPDYMLQVNFYPNAFWHTTPGVGFFGVVGQDGRWVGGLSLTGLFGVGIGAGTR